MGARKRNRAEQLKAARKNSYRAVLHNCPTSPRKMRLVADLIRGKEVNHALDMLKFSSKEASRRLEKLVLSAISNWQNKNEGARIEDSNLIIKEIQVDSARMLKRIQPAPQGRAYRIRKRSNHVTVVLGGPEENNVVVEQEETVNNTQTN
jgi:large subunit ribosomal protein L22